MRHHARHQAGSSDEEPEEETVRQPSKRRKLGVQRHQVTAVEAEESSEPPSSSGQEGSSDSELDSEPDSGPDSGAEGADIPLGELEKLRQDGSTSAAAMKARARALKAKGTSFKRENKHRPMEMSSKKPVPVFREVFQGGKREVRDPRFESLSGQYTEERFKRRYAFLYDDKLPQERKELKAAIQKAKNPGKRADLKEQLVRVEQQIRNEEARRKKEAFEKDLKSKEKEAVAGGKNPFYLKKSDKKRLELVAKYEALKASGGLEKFMAKRRKKNAAKDHRYLPVGRRGGGGGGGGVGE